MRNIEEIKPILEEIKENLSNVYGDKIKSILLYGSFAKNQASEKSDVDILVVTSDELDSFVIRERLSEFLYDLFLEKGELVSLIVIPESTFASYRSPFLLNVKEEAITI